jgi:NADH-quinone oxidoreductase subunit E
VSVRRLHAEQPTENFAFNSDNLAWAKQTIAKYPAGKQASAVIPLLWRAQEQNQNWVSKPVIEYVADMLGMSYIRVLEVATFYTMFQLEPVGKVAHIQVCGTTPCMLRGAEDLKKVCQNRIHHDPHHISADGNFSWEEVECLGACVNAPMVQIFKDTYEDLTPASLEKLIDDLANGRKVKVGPQIDRHHAAPEGGPTTLTDPALYDGARTFTRVEPPPPPPPADAPAAAAPAPAAPAPAAPAPAPVAAAAPATTDADKPETLSTPRDGGKADDLKLIWGVGPKLEQLLHSMGIFHFDQVAKWTERELAWVDERLEGFKGRAKRDDWIEQCKKLMTGWRPESGVGDKPEKK